jgi:hypothetical protein
MPAIRPTIAIVAAAVLMAAAPAPAPPRAAAAAVFLRITSLTEGRIDSVEITARPAGLRDAAGSRVGDVHRRLLRDTPITLLVADSVQELRVRVLDPRSRFAVSVRFDGPATTPWERYLKPWGRDLTFQRVDGQWIPKSRVHRADPTTE